MRKLSKEKTANRQALSEKEEIQQKEERRQQKIQKRIDKKDKEINLQKQTQVEKRLDEKEQNKVVDDILGGKKEKVIQLTAPISTAVFQRDEKLSTRRPKSQAINKASVRTQTEPPQSSVRTQTEPPQRINRRPDIAQRLREGGIGIQPSVSNIEVEIKDVETEKEVAKETNKNHYF